MLPRPGSERFIEGLIRHTRTDERYTTFQPDLTLFSAILLNLLVNNGGLIIDLFDPSPRDTIRTIDHVKVITRGLFGLETGCIRFKDDLEPDQISMLVLDSPGGKRNQGEGEKARDQGEREQGDRNQGESGPTINEVLIISGVEQLSGPCLLQLNDILVKRSLIYKGGKIPLPPNFLLVWIKYSSINTQSKKTVDTGWWIDQFVSSIHVHPTSIPKHTIKIGQKDDAPITKGYIRLLSQLLDYTHIHPPLTVHMSNLFSAINGHPKVIPTLTGKCQLTFPKFVKAHRLLSSEFALPPDYELALTQRVRVDRFGLDGGENGVSSWSKLAGEQPDLESLTLSRDPDRDPVQGWFCSLGNVEGVWKFCLGHRVRPRGFKQDIMWVMSSSSSSTPVSSKHEDGITQRKESEIVDAILDDILRRV